MHSEFMSLTDEHLTDTVFEWHINKRLGVVKYVRILHFVKNRAVAKHTTRKSSKTDQLISSRPKSDIEKIQDTCYMVTLDCRLENTAIRMAEPTKNKQY